MLSVPPLWVDGFTTEFTPALKAELDELDDVLLPLLPQAASSSAATAPTAASAVALGLFTA
jgi:hypothetical protein